MPSRVVLVDNGSVGPRTIVAKTRVAPMTSPHVSLRVLFVEDSGADAELLLHELRRGGYAPLHERVETSDEMIDALARQAWDLIISDYNLPVFNAPSALGVLHEAHLDIPFIIVSGSIGETTAVEAMRAGAHDYVMKDNLSRLNSVIGRELREAESRHQRRRAERALHESEARYRQMVETAAEGIWLLDAECGTEFINTRMSEMLGQTAEGPPASILELASDPPRDTLRSLLTGQTESRRIDACLRRPDGSDLFTGLSVSTVRDSGGRRTGTLVMVTDETERRRLEDQFRQAQKMEAIGQLAGGVAHDFNNLLTAILGYAHLLNESLQPDDARRTDLDEIRKAGERAASLTQQLLAFSRRQLLQPVLLDFNTLVADMAHMLRRLIGEHIMLETRLAPELAKVKADPGQIQQILMNLAVNARDAMPKGGQLVIETANAELDDEYARHHPAVTPGLHVMLGVSDTGLGMDAATQKRIFEPFFTTKPLGKGTGLGLSTVYGIVKQSGGYIWVYSEPGRGTSFRIYLPVADGEVVAVSTRGQHEAAGGRETILVVEDDQAVRSLSQRILEGKGYRVIDADTPEAALAIARAYADSIDLLVTDVLMPGGTGPDLYRQLTVERPGLKVLFMSGYSDDAAALRGELTVGRAFLQKPFTTDSLARKVRDTLDA